MDDAQTIEIGKAGSIPETIYFEVKSISKNWISIVLLIGHEIVLVINSVTSGTYRPEAEERENN